MLHFLFSELSYGVTALILVLVALVWLVLATRARQLDDRSGLSEKPHWWAGHLGLALKHEDRITHFFLETSQQFQWKAWWMCMPLRYPSICLATRADVMEHVFKTNFDNYSKPPDLKKRFSEIFGGGIFASDGQGWRRQRKTASHMFSLRSMRDDMFPVFVKHGNTVLRKLKEAMESSSEINMEDIFFKYTLTSFSEIAFGEDVDAINRDNVPFAVAFDTAQTLSDLRFNDLMWQLKRLFGLGTEKELAKAIKVCDDYAFAAIAKRRKAVDRSKKPDLISRFITGAEERNETVDDVMLRDIMINFLIAGRDTTAAMLTWAMYELHLHPEVEKEMAQHIQQVLDKHNLSPGEITYAATNDLVYCEAVMLETLRLHPSVPLDVKFSLGEDTLPDGTYVPKDTVIIYSPYCFGRSPTLWDDPLKFDPYRWMERKQDGTVALKPLPSQYKFIAFNAGPRLCLGRSLALLEAKALVAMMWPRFKFALTPGQDITQMRTVILKTKNGLRVSVQER